MSSSFIIEQIYRAFLSKNGLVIKQVYVDRNADQGVNGVLLHLPRFYSEFKPKYMLLTEQIVEILKTKPNYVLTYAELNEYLPIVDIKKLFKSPQFQQFIATDMVTLYFSILLRFS